MGKGNDEGRGPRAAGRGKRQRSKGVRCIAFCLSPLPPALFPLSFSRAITAKMTVLSETAVRDWFERQVPLDDFRRKRVLVLVPDLTRTAPLPLLVDALWDRLSAVVRGLDMLVALGTHPPLSEAQIGRLLGIEGERRAKFSRVQVFNHDWNND